MAWGPEVHLWSGQQGEGGSAPPCSALGRPHLEYLSSGLLSSDHLQRAGAVRWGLEHLLPGETERAGAVQPGKEAAERGPQLCAHTLSCAL